MIKCLIVALGMWFPVCAQAQYLDGLPKATVVSPSDIGIVCQGGATGKPGTCTTRQAPISAIQSGITTATPITATNSLGSLTATLGTWISTLFSNTVTVTSNANLKSLIAGQYSSAQRLGFYAPGDGGAAQYNYSTSNCAANGLVNDTGACNQPNTGGGSWIAALSEPLHLETWGGQSNGTTDNLAAFNAAIAFLKYSSGVTTSGGEIQPLAGSYYISGSVNMSGRHGLKITGLNNLASTVTSNGGNYPLFIVSSTVAAPTNAIEVSNLNLNCGGMSNTSADGIKWSYVNNGTITKNLVLGCHHGVDLTGQYLTNFSENNITGQGSQQNSTCLYMGFPTDTGDTFGNNAIIAHHNLCQFTGGDAARIVDGNGSIFDHNQWLGPGGMGIHACDQPAATYPSGETAVCEFMFFDQDQTDTVAGVGWSFKLGSGGQVGPGIILLQPWAGSTHTAAFDIEGVNNIQIVAAEIETTDIGFDLVNVQNSRIDGHVFAYNARNNGSQSVLLSGTSPGSQNNDVHIDATTSNPISPSYNGIVETGGFSGNRLDAGFADCSSTLGLAFGGSTTGIAFSSNSNVCRYEVHGTEVSLQTFFDLTSKGSATGAAALIGLPIVAGPGNFSGYGAINPCQAGDGTGSHAFTGLTGSVLAEVVPAATTALLNMQGATDIAAVANSNFGNTSALGCQLHYQKQ